MSDLIEHAKRELQTLGASTEDEILSTYVLRLIELLDHQSDGDGGKAGFILHMFMTLGSFGLLTPLTGKPDEWNEPEALGERSNKRAPNVIKRVGGMVIDTQAIIYLDHTGEVVNRKGSTKFVKKFPYMPTPEVVHLGVGE